MNDGAIKRRGISKLVIHAILLVVLMVLTIVSTIFALVFSNTFLGVLAAASFIFAVAVGVLVAIEGHKKKSQHDF
jgi:hypothetical protein